jgi:Flp pilus assembly protein TadD
LKVRQDVYTYDALGWALFKNGKIEEAAKAMDRALSQNSPEPSFHDHAARIFEACGRSAEAKALRAQARADYW